METKSLSGKQTREMSLDGMPSADNKTIALSFASETPVLRWYGNEILSCDPKDVDLTRLNDGGPLLMNHEDLIGVVESASVDSDKVCRAKCKLSRNAVEAANDLADGILRKASVGYKTISIVEDIPEKPGQVRTIKWSWCPYEISLVSVPADNSVGIGRSAGGDETQKPQDIPAQETKDMSEKKDDIAAPAAKVEVVKDNSAEVRRQSAEIMKLARQHGVIELGEKALDDGKSLDQFRAEVLDMVGKRSHAPSKPADASIGLSEREVKSYSFLRAIRSMLPHDGVDAGFEQECSRAVAKRIGRDPKGIFVPWDVQSHKRDLTVAGTGSNAVATNMLGGSFIEALRNAMVLNRVGATMLTGLSGDIAIPKQDAAGTAYWVSEGLAPTESQLTLGQVTGTPHSVAANQDYTRKMIMQSSVDVEALIRADLAEIIARGIDYACFNDAGAGSPSYLLGVSGVNNPSINTAGSATYAEILAFASSIAADNVSTDGASWVTTNEVFYNLCGLPRHATASAAGFIADVDNSTIIGRPAIQSESLPANTAVFGVWKHLIVAMWGNGLDIVVDPYTQSKAGIVQVTAFTDVDLLVRHAQAFAYNSAVTS